MSKGLSCNLPILQYFFNIPVYLLKKVRNANSVAVNECMAALDMDIACSIHFVYDEHNSKNSWTDVAHKLCPAKRGTPTCRFGKSSFGKLLLIKFIFLSIIILVSWDEQFRWICHAWFHLPQQSPILLLLNMMILRNLQLCKMSIPRCLWIAFNCCYFAHFQLTNHSGFNMPSTGFWRRFQRYR